MSALPKPNPERARPSGYVGMRMTAPEFLSLGELRERYELVDGVIVMSPSPSPRHQKIARVIQRQLETYGDRRAGFEFFPDTDLRLSADLVLRPDFACFAPGRLAEIPRQLNVLPDLVIEILSPGSKAFDLTTKRDDYEKFGVGEYWAYDPDDGSLRRYTREAGKFVESLAAADSVESVALAGIVLDLRPLRAVK